MASFYFSSSTGNNSTGNGSIGNPWFSFSAKKSGTSALSPDDICYLKAGDTWVNEEMIIDSNGTSGHPITIDRYGAGNDPVFNWGINTVAWVSTGANNIYYKSGLFGGATTVGVDGTSALYNQTYTYGKNATNIDLGCSFNSNGTIYIRLADGSNPFGHAIYVPSRYQSDSDRGIVRGSISKGSYVNINHITVKYAYGGGFGFSQPNSNFYDCTAIGCGRDGFLLNGYTPFGEMASYCRIYRSTASYCNAGGVGLGQAFTIGCDHAWTINCTAHHNFAAGFDFLDYSANTDVHHGGAIYCTAYQNGQAPSESSMYDPGIYSDGAHDMLYYGNVCYDSGVGSQNRDAANIFVQTEHQNKPTYNIHIVNNFCYNAQGANITLKKGGDYPNYNNAPSTYGNTIVNNTLVRGSGGYGCVMYFEGLGSATRTIFKNNIILRVASGYPALFWQGGTNSSNLDSDYNCYYDTTKSAIFSDNESSPSYTLAQWQTNRGLDAHSIQADPKLVNTTFATMDGHLQLTSPCINAGVNAPWTPPQWVIDAGVLADGGAVVGTTRADGVVDSGTLDMGYHYYAPTPYGSLTTTNIEPATLYLSSVNNVTVTFTTANPIPIDGKVVLTFPTSLGGGFTFNSGGSTVATFNSGGSGSLAVSSTTNVMTLTRSGGSVIAAGQAVSINLTQILNPPLAGATGAYGIKTTTSADTSIDIDIAVSSDQIIAAAAGFVTITISGIKMSQIKINNA